MHRFNVVRAERECFGQPCRRLRDKLGGRRIDDDKYVRLREGFHIFKSPLRPRQVGRKKILNVGFDREMAHRVNGGGGRQQDAEYYDPPGIPTAEVDNAKY